MISLAHDWLVSMRGGEWVLHRLAMKFGPTSLYTLVKSKSHLTEAIENCHIVTSPLQDFPGARGRLRRYYLPLMPWAVSRLRVEPCDLLISTSSSVIKAISPPPGVPHLCYCHSPARYLWDQIQDYEEGSGSLLRSAGLRAIQPWFQKWDRRTAQKVTTFLANSQHTAKRIRAVYDRDAQVVYPPVRTEFFTPDPQVKRDQGYLVVSALEPYKKTEMVIQWANQTHQKLIVAGNGTEFHRLKKMAGATVEMLGTVSENELLQLYRRTRALIFAQREDFGITAVEAQATGCPVIAFGFGGARETVNEKTGVFFSEQSIASLKAATEKFERQTISPTECRYNAEQFSEARFDYEIEAVVSALIQRA